MVRRTWRNDSASRPVGTRRMQMNRRDNRERRSRLAVSQLVRNRPPSRVNSLYEKPLTAPADRAVGAAAHAVTYTTAAANRGAGSVHRRPGMQTSAPVPACNRAGSRPATACRQTHRRRCRSCRLAASPTTAPRGGARQLSPCRLFPTHRQRRVILKEPHPRAA